MEKSNFIELVALPLAFCLQPGWGSGGGDPETQTKWKGKGKIAFLFFFGCSQASARGDHAIGIWRVPNFPLRNVSKNLLHMMALSLSLPFCTNCTSREESGAKLGVEKKLFSG